MPRRVTLPGASELFRPTRTAELESPAPGDRTTEDEASPTSGAPGSRPVGPASAATPIRISPPSPDHAAAAPSVRGSGRVRHDEKITVYVSSDELLALEQARLTLRARHGMAIDRGRIVREAIAATLADFDEHGQDSELIRRLGPS